MIYSIEAELLSPKFEQALSVKILKGNNLNLYTTIPLHKGESIGFTEGEQMRLSYCYDEFHYHFNVEFAETISAESTHKFIINDVIIEKNLRRYRRETVELNALIMDSKNMYYATVMDISEKGMKIQLDTPIQKKRIRVHYIDKEGLSKTVKGRIVWSSQRDGKYFCGVQLK